MIYVLRVDIMCIRSCKSNTWQQLQGNEDNMKETSGLTILRYGKGNNIYQFKQTLFKVSLREFGNLGKLIQRSTYFQPEYVPPSLPDNITSTMQNALTQTIYGVYPEYVKRKLTRKAVPRAKVDPMLQLNIKEQKLYTDVMHIDGKKFLITVTEPLNLTL